MNELTPEALRELADKYLKGTITEEEKKQLDQWYNSQSPSFVEWEPDRTEDELKERLYNNIASDLYKKVSARGLYSTMRWFAAAVIVMMVLSGTIYYLLHMQTSKPAIVKNNTINVIHPGGNKAILTLGDGSTIVLDSSQNGLLARQGNALVVKKNGQLAYESPANGKPRAREVLYNSITTPRGGQYQVTLPDGSQVWLNASSSLHFPTVFTENERRVEVSGEAYFEIVKKKGIPFKVQIQTGTDKNRGEVEVLGTHFNINSYPDEPDVKVTLLEGKVKIAHHTTVILEPGEQASITADIKVEKDILTEDVVAWKNGMLQFTDASLATIMRQTARWYDVEIIYKGNVENEVFSGSLQRSENLTALLKKLELTKTVQFSIEGKQVIVQPYTAIRK